MRALTIEARSLESAQALFDALSGFTPELIGNADSGYRVAVDLGGLDRRLVSVLDAIQRHVSERRDPARVELDGHDYTVHPE